MAGAAVPELRETRIPVLSCTLQVLSRVDSAPSDRIAASQSNGPVIRSTDPPPNLKSQLYRTKELVEAQHLKPIMSQPPTTSAPRSDEPDPRNSLRHVLAADPPKQDMPDAPTPVKAEAGQSAQDDDTTDDPKPKGDDQPMYTSTTTTTRRNANGSVSSVYSGNKIRHLKKEDGVPLWRKDIQYDFLRQVFDDQTRVFHKVSDGTGSHTFADIYLDAMAKSSKCSKILKDKLLTERAAAINMAMVCLLVNVGRMNTTLNCKSERTRSSPPADSFQSSPRCAPSCGPTTPFPRSKPTKTRTPTSSCKMHRVSSPSSRAPPKTRSSPAPSMK